VVRYPMPFIRGLVSSVVEIIEVKLRHKFSLVAPIS
jgi:hypothetical protein